MTGRHEKVLERIRKEELGWELETAAEELAGYVAALNKMENQTVILDFSMVNPLSYYNGLVFQGFLEGCSSYVLSGGRYDKLAMRFLPKHKETCRAIGFALDMDALEPFWTRKEEDLC